MAGSSSSEAIVEVREEAMVSPIGGTPTVRKAHFIQPSSSKSQTLCLSFPPLTFEPKKWSLKIKFNGWRYPPENWTIWVQKMASLHESTWKKAGIYEAIKNSTFKIRRNNDLVFGIAEKWLNETKSFIFPWGEATITLEDMMFLGGYTVLGSPPFVSVEADGLKEKVRKLKNVRAEMFRTQSKKPSHGSWIKKFMDSNDVEHEAFLILWLSRFVFPSVTDSIVKRVFPIAIELARGNRVSLAPAVLASIYRDLSSLKEFILATRESPVNELSTITLWSPLQLVQVWVWERFSQLRPQPNLAEPRLAKWHNLKFKVNDARSKLDSSGASFEWRPYVKGLMHPNFYPAKEMWVGGDSGLGLDEEVLAFARCLRVSMLVGLESLEQYLPHRVSIQFGMDQDVPDSVSATNESPEIAWSDYSKPVKGLYIPSRFCKGNVTVRYLEWWRKLVLNLQPKPTPVSPIDVESDSSTRVLLIKNEGISDSADFIAQMELDNSSPFPPGFPPKSKMVEAVCSADGDFGTPSCLKSHSSDSVDEDVQREIAELWRSNKKTCKNECQGPRNPGSSSIICQSEEEFNPMDHNNDYDDSTSSTAGAAVNGRDGKVHEMLIMSLDVEYRTSKLERAIERYKAAKSCQGH